MLWLLADESLDESQREKALLDAEELKEDDLSLDQDKVELDLDDAPFLDEEEEEEEEEVEEEVAEEEAEQKKKLDIKALLRDKRVVFGGLGGLLLLIGIIVAILLWPSPKEAPPVPEVPEAPAPATAPAEEEPPPPAEHIIAFKPFWVEHVTEDGSVRLLFFKFSVVTQNEKLAWEISHKTLVLRDAVFYYLKNKDLSFLSDKTNADQLKKDLLSVVNQYLNVGQVQELLIEEYLVK